MGKPLVPFLVPPGPKREDILAGTKTVTIRVGDRECPEDARLVIFCHFVPWVVMADVVSVRRCLVNEVTSEEWRDDGYEPATAMEQFITNLEPAHPDIGPDSVVTVIRFAKVRGKLVDDWKTGVTKLEELRRRFNIACCPACQDTEHLKVKDDSSVSCRMCGAHVGFLRHL